MLPGGWEQRGGGLQGQQRMFALQCVGNMGISAVLALLLFAVRWENLWQPLLAANVCHHFYFAFIPSRLSVSRGSVCQGSGAGV